MKLIPFFLLFLGISCWMQGIDLSSWDDPIDWEKASQYVDFAIIRVGDGLGHVKNNIGRI